MLASGNAEKGLMIYSGANNLRVRRMYFKDNLTKAADEPLRDSFVSKANHIVSHSPFPLHAKYLWIRQVLAGSERSGLRDESVRFH